MDGNLHPTKSLFLMVAVLWVAGPVSASAPAPTDLDGTYDPATETFTLTWEYDSSITVDEYNVYLDGVLLGSATTKSYDDDLDGFTGGLRTYTVAAMVDSDEGVWSDEYSVYFSPTAGVLRCPVVGTSLDPNAMPPVTGAVYEECLPPPPLGGGE